MAEDFSVDSPRPLFERLATMLLRVPEDREQLLTILREAHSRALLDSDALSMIEGVLSVSELTAADVMVPRKQMDVLDLSDPWEQTFTRVIEDAHSRFPVIDGDRDNVVGILHAKDLLRLQLDPAMALAGLLRPPVFVPESKRLNLLLRDFRDHHEHLAIVVDEYGGTAGLLTIEDILEEIVGEIEDEFDVDEQADHVVPMAGADGALDQAPRRWRVRAIATLEHLNEILGSHLLDEDVDTVGGLVVDRLGRVPVAGEEVEIDGLRFEVLRADPRQILLLAVEQAPPPAAEPADADTGQ